MIKFNRDKVTFHVGSNARKIIVGKEGYLKDSLGVEIGYLNMKFFEEMDGLFRSNYSKILDCDIFTNYKYTYRSKLTKREREEYYE